MLPRTRFLVMPVALLLLGACRAAEPGVAERPGAAAAPGSLAQTELDATVSGHALPQSPVAASVISLLPDGVEKRGFVLDGVLWIPEYAAGRIARFDPATSRFTEYDLPLRDAAPYVVRVDDERGRIWIGTGAADAVFLFDPRTERFATIPLPTRGALVRHIDFDASTGELWVAYGASPGIPPKIARIRLP